MKKNALIIGCSDGIGLGLARELLNNDWSVVGLSRSRSKIEHSFYEHYIIEVQNVTYLALLEEVIGTIGTLDLCIYCVGIGDLLDVTDMQAESHIFEVNLMGLVKTVSHVIPRMVSQGRGHFMGISSVADELLSAEAPSYHATKAGLSNYVEGLGVALKPKNVNVTNVRFGFVDTKMAKGKEKPFMISVGEAVEHLMKCIDKKPLRYTAPRIIIPLVKFRSWMQRFSAT